MPYLSRNVSTNISEKIIGKSPQKKHYIAPELLFYQPSVRIDLGSKDYSIEDSIAVLGKTVIFANHF